MRPIVATHDARRSADEAADAVIQPEGFRAPATKEQPAPVRPARQPRFRRGAASLRQTRSGTGRGRVIIESRHASRPADDLRGRVLQRLHDLVDVQSELFPARLDTRRLRDVFRAVTDAQPPGVTEGVEVTLQQRRVVRGCDEGRRLFLANPLVAGLLDLPAERAEESLELLLRSGREERLAQRLLELLAAAVFAENDVQLTYDQSEQLDLLVEDAEDAGLNGACGREVDDVRLASLADAMDAADPLLDDHRVPRQLVIHQPVAELEVEPFGTGPRCDEDAARLAPELLQAGDPLGEVEPSLEDDGGAAEVADSLADQLQRGEMLAEDDELVVMLGDDPLERVQLAVRVDRCGMFGEAACVAAEIGRDEIAARAVAATRPARATTTSGAGTAGSAPGRGCHAPCGAFADGRHHRRRPEESRAGRGCGRSQR